MDYLEPQRRFYKLTIKRQNITPSGLLEVEADNTDSVDTNGFSDVLNSVGVETAKFSGGATMQANSGLRIGMTQVKIVTGAPVIPLGVIIPTTVVTNPNNLVDGNDGTSTGPDNLVVSAINATVDYGAIITAKIKIRWQFNEVGTKTAIVEFSTDNVIWNTAFTSSVLGGAPRETISGNEFTYRYLRIRSGTALVSVQFYTLVPVAGASIDADVNIRSSTTIDTANGTILDSVTVSQSTTTTLDTELLLTGNNQFVTLEIVSFSGLPFNVNLSEITSIKEV